MEELHKCKYCGTETTQPDEECYAKPKQETLEEFIKDELQDEFFTNVSEYKKAERFIHIGAKWHQERSYSEEEVRNLIIEAISSCTDGLSSWYQDFDEWFEQNKKTQ